MSHYVLVQAPRKKSFYVICNDVDECLSVVEKETGTAPVGTRVTMLRSTGGGVLDVLSAWRVEKRGQARRYAINSSKISEGDVLHLKLERLPVYDSPHTSAGRRTSQLVTVRKIATDGRLIVRLKGKKPGYNTATISADRSEMSGQGPAGKRPFRYLILNIEKAT